MLHVLQGLYGYKVSIFIFKSIKLASDNGYQLHLLKGVNLATHQTQSPRC